MYTKARKEKRDEGINVIREPHAACIKQRRSAGAGYGLVESLSKHRSSFFILRSAGASAKESSRGEQGRSRAGPPELGRREARRRTLLARTRRKERESTGQTKRDRALGHEIVDVAERSSCQNAGFRTNSPR